MSERGSLLLDRRRFLSVTAACLATPAWGGEQRASGDGPGNSPRATSGDTHEPDWADRLTVTVGPKGADLTGADDKVIQAGADYVARLGGGTVRVLPGTFRLRNSVYLAARVRLAGSGLDSVLIKEPSVTTKLRADSDWYDQEITLEDARGFKVGDGICLRAKNPHHGGATVLKRTLVARSGDRFKLDRPLRENLWLAGTPTASSLFPLVSGDNVSDLVIEDLALDGNRSENENLDGNYSGCIFLQDCNRITIRRVTARNQNGDGISWQICHDVSVEDSHSHDHAGLGMHPGSGSQRPVIRNNKIERCDIGLFFCWGVRFGLAERNVIDACRGSGVSIGHRDTDNVVRDNTIRSSGKVGVLFRDEGRVFGGHRNRIEGNRIVDSGADDGVGVDVRGETENVTIIRNDVRETRGPSRRVGIRVGPKTHGITLTENHIEGCAEPVVGASG
ncbi:MAG: right-handed parallel beta-helix repeat-containing protein [Isosphaeraceae bacterium]|nr:right-handed parallel beta-helix repeat-containing protein [Isosphaeraceae bacterium]